MTTPITGTTTGTNSDLSPAEIRPSGAKTVKEIRDTKFGGALVNWVTTTHRRMQNDRQREARKWSYNLAMYEGKQYLAQTGIGDAARLIVPQAPRYRARPVTNRLRPIIRTEIAALNSQQPSATVSPASSETEDMYAAQAGEQLWESFYSRKRMKALNYRNSFWVAVTGNSFIKTYWDNDAVAADQEVVNPNNPLMRAQAVGDIEFSLVTPFHFFVPDLLEEELEFQPYCFQIYTKPANWARKFYDDPDIKANCSSSQEIFDNTYFNEVANQDATPNSVLVIEAWIKPGSVELLPDGGLITVAGNRLVGYSDQGLPYSHGMYPYDHTWHTLSGRFYRSSILEDLNPLQKEYNRTRAQIIESKNRTGRPTLLVPRKTMDIRNTSAEPGAIMEYNPAFGPPQVLQPPPIPNYILQELDVIKQDMEDISGQHAVSRGSAPGGGVVAATAIGFLQEKDDSLRAATYSSIEAAHEKRARMALQLAADYYDLPRIIKVTGTDMMFNALQLKGSDIANGLDIRMEGGSALPQSKQAKQALLMDMADRGYIPPNEMLSMLDMGGISRIIDRLEVDRTEAERENLRFKNLQNEEIMQYMMDMQEQAMNPDTDPETGMPLNPPSIIPVETWQNHAVHITVHNNFRKGQEFQAFPDEIKALMEMHVQLHQIAMQGNMQQQQMGLAPPDSMPVQDTGMGQPQLEPGAGPTGGMQ